VTPIRVTAEINGVKAVAEVRAIDRSLLPLCWQHECSRKHGAFHVIGGLENEGEPAFILGPNQTVTKEQVVSLIVEVVRKALEVTEGTPVACCAKLSHALLYERLLDATIVARGVRYRRDDDCILVIRGIGSGEKRRSEARR